MQNIFADACNQIQKGHKSAQTIYQYVMSPTLNKHKNLSEDNYLQDSGPSQWTY